MSEKTNPDTATRPVSLPALAVIRARLVSGALLLALLGPVAANAQDKAATTPVTISSPAVETDGLSAPAKTRDLLRFDSAFAPWEAWKKEFKAATGISFGGSVGLLWQDYSDPLNGKGSANGYKLTFNASAELLNRGSPDALAFELVVEERGPIGGGLAPLQGGLGAGNVVPPAATWGNFDLGVTQAYIRQSLFDNSFQYAFGRVFAPNFVNSYPFFDDNRQFLNQNFSTSPTIASPLRGFGAVALWFPTETGLYLQGGVYTANSADTGNTVDSFFNDGEHFTHIDIGWSGLTRKGVPIQSRGPTDKSNIHLMYWHKDAQPDAKSPVNRPEMEGVAFNVNQPIGDDGMWFLRGGVSDGWVTERALSGGVGFRPKGTGDLWGVAVGWTDPADFISSRDQTVVEAFYRYQVTTNFAITPDIQVIRDPSVNPTVDQQIVLSMRARLTF